MAASIPVAPQRPSRGSKAAIPEASTLVFSDGSRRDSNFSAHDAIESPISISAHDVKMNVQDFSCAPDVENEIVPAMRKFNKFWAVILIPFCIGALVTQIWVGVLAWDKTAPWYNRVPGILQDEVKSVMDVLKIMERCMICVNCGPPAILIILIIQYIATRLGKTDKAWQPPTFWGLLGIYIWKIGLPIILFTAVNVKTPTYVPYDNMAMKMCEATVSLSLYPPGATENEFLDTTFQVFRGIMIDYFANTENHLYKDATFEGELKNLARGQWQNTSSESKSLWADIKLRRDGKVSEGSESEVLERFRRQQLTLLTKPKDVDVKTLLTDTKSENSSDADSAIYKLFDKYMKPKPAVTAYCKGAIAYGQKKMGYSLADASGFSVVGLVDHFENIVAGYSLLFKFCNTKQNLGLSWPQYTAVPGGNYPVAINKDLTVEQVCAEWAKGHQNSSTIPAKFKPYFLGANETGNLKFPELARTANLTGLPFTKDDGWPAMQSTYCPAIEQLLDKTKPMNGGMVTQARAWFYLTAFAQVGLQKIARTKLGNLLPANFSSIQRLSDKIIDVVCPEDGQAKGLGDKRICFFNNKAFTNANPADISAYTGQFLDLAFDRLVEKVKSEISSQVAAGQELSRQATKDYMRQVIKSTTFPEGQCVDNGDGTNSLTDRCVDGQPCECVEDLNALGDHFEFASTYTGELQGVPFVSTEDFSQKINEAIAGEISDITEQSSILTRAMMAQGAKGFAKQAAAALVAGTNKVKYLIGMYVGFLAIIKLIPFAIALLSGLMTGLAEYSVIVAKTEIITDPNDTFTLRRMAAMLTITAISVFILPMMILPLFIYQFMATQIFIISVIGMSIKLLSTMYFLLKKVEKPDEGIWHRGPIVVDVIAYVMMVLGTILWLVEDKDNEILKFVWAKGLGFLRGQDSLMLANIIMQMAFNFVFAQFATVNIIAGFTGVFFKSHYRIRYMDTNNVSQLWKLKIYKGD